MEVKSKYNIGDIVYGVCDYGEYRIFKFSVHAVKLSSNGFSYEPLAKSFSTHYIFSESNVFISEKQARERAYALIDEHYRVESERAKEEAKVVDF